MKILNMKVLSVMVGSIVVAVVAVVIYKMNKSESAEVTSYDGMVDKIKPVNEFGSGDY